MNNIGFVKKLESFTNSLEDLVEILKIKENNSTDSLYETMDSMPDKISKISEELSEIKKEIVDLKNTTNNINKIVSKTKDNKDKEKDKGAGLVDNIVGKNKLDKQKIVDSAKIIGLISGGVLSMGIALKLIGKVDPLSIVTLSTGISILTLSFIHIIGQLKKDKISNKDIKNFLIILPLLSTAVLVSGAILKALPILKVGQMITMVSLSLSLGLSLYLMSNTINSIKKDGSFNMKNYFMLPVILPLISSGIFLSASLLKFIPIIDSKKYMTILVTSAALGISLFLMSKPLKYLKDSSVKDFLKLPIILPAIASGILASSVLLSLINLTSDINYFSILKISLTVGMMSLIMLPTIYVINKFKVSSKDILKSTLSMVLISGAILAIGYLFNEFSDVKFDNDKVPDYNWTTKVGLSLLIFSVPMYVLSKIDNKSLLTGFLGVILVSTSIMTSSYILSIGDYSKYPPIDWSLGVGLSLLVFGISTIALGSIIMLSGGLVGAGVIVTGMIATIALSGTILAVDYILNKGNWGKYPSEEWSKGVGLSLLSFGISSVALGTIIIGTIGVGAAIIAAGLLSILSISKTMVEVDKVLNKGKWGKYPSEEWSKGVSSSLIGFIDAMNRKPGLWDTISSWFGNNSNNNLIDIANSIIDINDKFKDWKPSLVPSKDWTDDIINFILSFSDISQYDDINIDFNQLSNIIKGINLISLEMTKGKWTNNKDSYPSIEWSKSVSMSLMAFSSIFSSMNNMNLTNNDFGEQGKLIIKGLEDISIFMNNKKWSKVDKSIIIWSKDIGDIFDNILNIDLLLDKNKIWKSSKKVNIFNKKLYNMINSINNMSIVLKNVKFNKLKNIKEWSNGIKLSTIDILSILSTIDKSDFNNYSILTLESIFDSMIKINDNISNITFKEINGIDIWSKDIGITTRNMVNVLENVHNGDFDSNWFSNTTSALVDIFDSIVEINNKINNVSFKKNNGIDIWSKDISNVVNNVINMLEKIHNGNLYNMTSLISIFNSIVDLNSKLGVKWNSIDENWIKSFKMTLDVLNEIPNGIDVKIDNFIKSFEKLSKLNIKFDVFNNLSKSINNLSQSMNNLNLDSLSKLTNLTNSVVTLSLIDVDKLDTLLNKLSDNNDIKELLTIINKNQNNQPIINVSPSKNDNDNKINENYNKMIKLMEDIKKIITTISEDVDISNHVKNGDHISYKSNTL